MPLVTILNTFEGIILKLPIKTSRLKHYVSFFVTLCKSLIAKPACLQRNIAPILSQTLFVDLLQGRGHFCDDAYDFSQTENSVKLDINEFSLVTYNK